VISSLRSEMAPYRVVTRPFRFEGQAPHDAGERACRNCSNPSTTLIVIPNEKLLAVAKSRLLRSFRIADDVLRLDEPEGSSAAEFLRDYYAEYQL